MNIEVLKEKLNPDAMYLMKEGPFGENTVIVVVDDAISDKLDDIVEDIEVDFDFAVVTKSEFERIREVVEESGEKLW